MKDNNIFSYISPLANNSFSRLRGLDLQEIIVLIENFYLTYRDTIDIDKDISFGIEIEYENLARGVVDLWMLLNLRSWKSVSDSSLRFGGEINSRILHDDKKCWEELSKVCKYLKSKKASTTGNAGGHIHIGAHTLGSNINAWRKFIKTYAAYENIIYRFVYGDKVNARKKMYDYATPIAVNIKESLFLINKIKDMQDLKCALPTRTRFQAINFDNVLFKTPEEKKLKNTVEFRAPNATIEEVIWQNNVNLFAKLIMACKRNDFDEDFIDRKLNKIGGLKSTLLIYDEMDLKNALEFADLIFDKNIDKVYFLRQYIKNFEITYDLEYSVKCRRFIR